MNLREQVELMLPDWERWYPSLFDAASDLGLIKAEVCDPGSLLLTRRHAKIRQRAEDEVGHARANRTDARAMHSPRLLHALACAVPDATAGRTSRSVTISRVPVGIGSTVMSTVDTRSGSSAGHQR